MYIYYNIHILFLFQMYLSLNKLNLNIIYYLSTKPQLLNGE